MAKFGRIFNAQKHVLIISEKRLESICEYGIFGGQALVPHQKANNAHYYQKTVRLRLRATQRFFQNIQ